MNDRETLSRYRMAEAEQTLAGDARKMLASGVSARSVVNRAYYAMFYGVLALLLHEDIEHTTSKHSGIISIFDKTMVHSGGLGREYSRMLHRIFDARHESDYKEFIQYSVDDADECVRLAQEFPAGIGALINQSLSK